MDDNCGCGCGVVVLAIVIVAGIAASPVAAVTIAGIAAAVAIIALIVKKTGAGGSIPGRAPGGAAAPGQGDPGRRRGVLPRSKQRRADIVKQFSARFRLYLTDEQVNLIVNASYISNLWQSEIEVMQGVNAFETAAQWLQGDTRWLRAYLKAFTVQEITSDMRQQEDIVTAAFDAVFSYVDGLPDIPLADKIARVNREFFTLFDDVSFMIAYRFLESKGLKHRLTGGGPVRNEGDPDVDELLKRYRKKTDESPGE